MLELTTDTVTQTVETIVDMVRFALKLVLGILRVQLRALEFELGAVLWVAIDILRYSRNPASTIAA
jgi:hypothetical protein